jgi:hypothetical protein
MAIHLVLIRKHWHGEKLMTAISQHYLDTHVKVDNLETRVAIYEDQVRGWFHDQARILEKASDGAGFVILLVVLSYVEGHAIFYRGEDSKYKSEEFFIGAFEAIFLQSSKDDPNKLKSAIKELYNQLRNGLFHTGITRSKVVLSGDFPYSVRFEPDPTSDQVSRIQVNPHKMLREVEDHLAHYVMRLRNPDETQLRENFNKAWNLRFV